MSRRINLGCGGNHLGAPWENFDAEVDITKPLPFPDECAQFILIEHCREHVPPEYAWRFIGEAHRVLTWSGVLRIAVPSIERVWAMGDNHYLEWLKKSGFGEATRKSAIANLIVNHGHQALWSFPLLQVVLQAHGFRYVKQETAGQSSHSELSRVEGHHVMIGERNNLIETLVVEATK
jgi:Uncharacterized protein conserved in bacteria